MVHGKFSRLLLLLLLAVLTAGGSTLRAQLISPIGGWHNYLSYFSIIDITHRGDYIYAASEGGFFKYHRFNRSSKAFSTINGMSNLNPTALYNDPLSNTIFIGYQDGTINTLDTEDEFGYITDISRSDLFTTRRINKFISQDSLLYIATEFGIVVYDIDRNETRFSITKIRENQSGLSVNDLAISQGRLWASVSNLGLFSVDLSLPNITLPEAWEQESGTNDLPLGIIPYVCNTGDTLYSNIGDTIFRLLPGGTWTYSSFPIDDYRDVGSNDGMIYASNKSQIYVQRPDGSLIIRDNFGTIQTSYVTGDTTWAGDLLTGLQWFPGDADRIFSSPNGPRNNFVTEMSAGNGELYIAPRGKNGVSDRFYDKSGIPYFNFQDGGWEVISHTNGKLSTDSVWQDFARTYYHIEDSTCYVGSFAEGIVVLKHGEVQRIYNDANSGLLGSLGRNRVSGLDMDEAGNLWVTQIVNDFPIHVLTPEGEWYRFRPTAMDAIGVIIDDYNNKWINNQNKGIVVFNDNFTPEDPSDDQVKTLTTDFGRGGLPDNSVFAIVQDRDEQIWVGTSSGITIFYDPSIIWTDQFQDAACPLIDGFCLLRDQKVSDIVVDAANRKWIATENGVFFVNEDGTELLEHFTTENSPIPDNDVKALALDQSTGELFIGTAKGTVSFIGTSIEGREGLAEQLYTFPNPVREDHLGVVMIKNMQQESTVKITTASGLLVRELQSLGGEVPWDMTDTYGNRIPPGIYLVMVSTADGENTGITKLAVIERPQ